MTEVNLPELFAFEVWLKGHEGKRVVNHVSMGKARSLVYRDLEGDMPIVFTDVRARKLGPPQDTDRLKAVQANRGRPELHAGVRVKVRGAGNGRIVDGASGANFAVLMDEGHRISAHTGEIDLLDPPASLPAGTCAKVQAMEHPLSSYCHIFTDTEAMGPPGHGEPFAFAAVHFELDGKILEGRQWNFQTAQRRHHPDTIAWLVEQRPEVLQQLRGERMPFSLFFMELRTFISEVSRGRAVMLWSDDWGDPAWIDIAAREWSMGSVRELGCWADSTGFVKLAQSIVGGNEIVPFEGMQHIALDDARHGSRELTRSLSLLGLVSGADMSAAR